MPVLLGYDFIKIFNAVEIQMNESVEDEDVSGNPEGPKKRLRMASSGLEAPTYYADAIRGSMISKNIVKMNFVEYRQDLDEKEQVVSPVLQLVIPVSQVKHWVNFFQKIQQRIDSAETETAG